MKNKLRFALLISAGLLLLSACGNKTAAQPPAPAAGSPAPAVSAPAAPTASSPAPAKPPKAAEAEIVNSVQEQVIAQQSDAGGLEAAHSDVQGEEELHFTFEDGENNLVLYYPNVFASYGEYDENGYVHFMSMQDNTELLYWVTPNTYDEDPAAFCERVSPFNGKELERNVVIGYGESLNQETGEETMSAFYWVVDVDWIVNVSISCETPEAAAEWCRLMEEEYILYVE